MSDSGNVNECCGESFGHKRNCQIHNLETQLVKSRTEVERLALKDLQSQEWLSESWDKQNAMITQIDTLRKTKVGELSQLLKDELLQMKYSQTFCDRCRKEFTKKGICLFGDFVTVICDECYEVWHIAKDEIENLQNEKSELLSERLELKNLVKWLYIQTNGLDSSFDLSHDFVNNLKNYLEPLEYCLKNEVSE